jgi:hypothetical protein
MNIKTGKMNLARIAMFAGLTLGAGEAEAGVIYNIAFDDPGGAWSPYYAAIRSNLTAAGAQWSRYLAGNAAIDISVRFDSIPTASGYSATSAYVGSSNGYWVYAQGAASEVRTGVDPNGAAPDAILEIGTSYLRDQLWFDPSPTSRTTPVPTTRTDAESVFTHELGHIFGFNGWRDGTTGALPGGYESTFDQYVVSMGGNLYFTGAKAVAAYGGYVPLTTGDYGHLGNRAPAPGSNLLGDLMNGVQFLNGTRYGISKLDLAILADVGVPLTSSSLFAGAPAPAGAAAPSPADVPEPGTLILLIGALTGIGLARVRHG